MQKDLLIESIATPDQDGYRDKIVILQDNKSVFHCKCSECPNPYRPNDGALWASVYAWVACNTKETPYRWKCVSTPKHDKCLMLNDGGAVPTRNIDIHTGKKYATAVELHCGATENWRGSMACITFPPTVWPAFIGEFLFGETGLLYIVDYSKTILEIPVITS